MKIQRPVAFVYFSGVPDLETQFVRDSLLIDTIASQFTQTELFPTNVKLLPPDIVKQIERSRRERGLDRDKYVHAKSLVLESVTSILIFTFRHIHILPVTFAKTFLRRYMLYILAHHTRCARRGIYYHF